MTWMNPMMTFTMAGETVYRVQDWAFAYNGIDVTRVHTLRDHSSLSHACHMPVRCLMTIHAWRSHEDRMNALKDAKIVEEMFTKSDVVPEDPETCLWEKSMPRRTPRLDEFQKLRWGGSTTCSIQGLSWWTVHSLIEGEVHKVEYTNPQYNAQIMRIKGPAYLKM